MSDRCTRCDSPLPEGADFCVECGAPVAATGRTVALDERRVTAHAPPRELPVPAAPQPAQAPAARRRRGRGGLCGGGWQPFAGGVKPASGAIFLIGLGLLFLTGSFWPGILALVGLTGAIDELAKGNARAAGSILVFMGGLAILFATGPIWPGILILIGLVALLERIP